jgi:hypothetical protein
MRTIRCSLFAAFIFAVNILSTDGLRADDEPFKAITGTFSRVQQRRELLAKYQPQPKYMRRYAFGVIRPTSKTAGSDLHQLGERDLATLHLYLHLNKGSNFRPDEIERAAKLFPEATIYIYTADPLGRQSRHFARY